MWRSSLGLREGHFATAVAFLLSADVMVLLLSTNFLFLVPASAIGAETVLDHDF